MVFTQFVQSTVARNGLKSADVWLSQLRFELPTLHLRGLGGSDLNQGRLKII